MADIKITDLVDEKVFEDLKKLSDDIKDVKEKYVETARELAQGLNMKISTSGDLEKLSQSVAESSRKAQEATDQLNTSIGKHREIVAQTTNTISRELAEIEKENKAKREAFEQDKSAISIAESLLGTRQQNIIRLADLQGRLKEVKKAQKELDDQEKSGAVSSEKSASVRANLIAKQREYQAAIKDLNLVLNNQEKQMQASEGSYQKLSLQLELMKKAYKGLSEEEKNSDMGKTLGEEIGNLDAHLKDLAADMGEFQRNTGNYAVANQSVKTELRELVQEIATLTIQYRSMSEEERKSAAGQELEAKMDTLKARASELKDAVADVNREIQSGANDTKNLSAITEGINILVSGMGGLTAASHALGVGEKDLIKIQTNLQAALAASNALTKVQTALQAESNLMQGVARVQQMAHATAIQIKTAAEGESVIVTKAATVAQAAFNAVANMNPYVLLATGIGLLVAAIVSFTSSTKKETEEQKKAREEMERSKKEYEEMMDVTTRLQEAREKGVESCASEIGQLQLLYSAATDTTRSMNERRLAAEKLQKLYPDYLGNLKTEAIIAGDARVAYEELNSAIINHAIVKAKEELIEKYAQKVVDSLEKVSIAQQELNKITGNTDLAKALAPLKEKHEAEERERQKHGKRVLSIEESEIYESNKKRKEQYDRESSMRKAQLQQEITEAKKQAEDYKKAMEEVNKSVDISDLLKDFKTNTSGGTTKSGNKEEKEVATKTYEEIEEVILEYTKETIAEKIALTEEGSEEEYDLTLQYIEAEKQLRLIELKKSYDEEYAALTENYEKEKSAHGISLEEQKALQTKYEQDIKDLENSHRDQQINATEKAKAAKLDAQKKYAEAYISSMQKMYEDEQNERNLDFTRQTTYLMNLRSQHLITEEQYQKELSDLKQQYANETADKEIEMLEKVLEKEELVAEQRKDISEKLKEAKVKAASDTAEAELDNVKEVEKKDKKSYETRTSNATKYMRKISSLLGDINDLVSTIYDNQIDKIEEEMDANDEAYEKEIEQIENLEETGAISKEEAEARKRAAEERTEAKEEELEAKKAEIEYKQAVWEKATSIAQAGIATALAITEALPNVVLAAIVGAMGAVEIATIIATPISSYAKGTKDKNGHPGGLALVGDAGKREAVVFDNKMWITPDTPTLVDMPKGAIVYPDADRVPEPVFMTAVPVNERNGGTVVTVVRDSKKVEKGISQTNHLLRQSIIMQRRLAYDASYAQYKATRL